MMPPNPAIVIPIDGGAQGIHNAIDGNPYSGFPLVNEKGAVIGLCERVYLEQLLEEVEQQVFKTAGSVTENLIKTLPDGNRDWKSVKEAV